MSNLRNFQSEQLEDAAAKIEQILSDREGNLLNPRQVLHLKDRRRDIGRELRRREREHNFSL